MNLGNELFFVEAIQSHKKYPVYGVSCDSNGEAIFLMWKNEQWIWAPARIFKPTI